ncbi:MAG: hypothetical protein UH850_14835 [Paludibacteraceae bacterium]|nr:hypothetical protein [Paludibacteraceae bacterium]
MSKVYGYCRMARVENTEKQGVSDLIKDKQYEVIEKASNIDCWYVMCAFKSYVSKEVEFRIAYFEERHDAECFIVTLIDRYKALIAPHYIVSNAMDNHIGAIADLMN